MAAGSPGYRSPSSKAVRSGERIAASNMARSRSSFGLFGIFGRSYDLRQFDQSLRALDVHPALVPEAVKLTAVNLLKDHADDDDPSPQASQVERRTEAALDYTGTLDAQLVLLALHSKIIQPSVVSMFGLESAGD